MQAKQLSLYVAKLLAGLAISTFAWLALPVQGGDRTVTAAQTAEHKTLERNCRSCHDLHPEKLRDAASLPSERKDQQK